MPAFFWAGLCGAVRSGHRRQHVGSAERWPLRDDEVILLRVQGLLQRHGLEFSLFQSPGDALAAVKARSDQFDRS